MLDAPSWGRGWCRLAQYLGSDVTFEYWVRVWFETTRPPFLFAAPSFALPPSYHPSCRFLRAFLRRLPSITAWLQTSPPFISRVYPLERFLFLAFYQSTHRCKPLSSLWFTIVCVLLLHPINAYVRSNRNVTYPTPQFLSGTRRQLQVDGGFVGGGGQGRPLEGSTFSSGGG